MNWRGCGLFACKLMHCCRCSALFLRRGPFLQPVPNSLRRLLVATKTQSGVRLPVVLRLMTKHQSEVMTVGLSHHKWPKSEGLSTFHLAILQVTFKSSVPLTLALFNLNLYPQSSEEIAAGIIAPLALLMIICERTCYQKKRCCHFFCIMKKNGSILVIYLIIFFLNALFSWLGDERLCSKKTTFPLW